MLCLTVLGWTAAGRTASPKTVVSFAFPADSYSTKAAALVNKLARDHFTKAPGWSLIDPSLILEEGARDPRLSALESARKALAAGKDQYENIELETAVAKLTRAEAEFQKAIGRLGNGEEYVETLLYLGAAYILSGEVEKGAEVFRRVLLFQPSRNLDTRVFPPAMLEIFKKAKLELQATPLGGVVIKSNLPGSEVYLNGSFRGITPLTLSGLPVGSHWVELRADGCLPWGQRIQVLGSRQESFEGVLNPLPGQAQWLSRGQVVCANLDRNPPDRVALELAAVFHATHLAVFKVRQSGDEVVIEGVLIGVNPASRLAFQTARVNLTSPQLSTQLDGFVALLSGGGSSSVVLEVAKKEAGPVLVVPRCEADSDCASGEVCDNASGRCIPYTPEQTPIVKAWWFWSLVGGGLAIAGGTAYLIWALSQPDRGSVQVVF